MKRIFLGFCAALDRATTAACFLAGVVLVVSILVIVVLRYGFGMGFLRLQDLATYSFAIFLILSLPVCLARGGHVRVEVLSERMSPRYLRIADILALLFLLIPIFGLAIQAYWPELSYSWRIRERALETGGLPGLYLVKTVLPVAAALMILQGIAAVLAPPAREASHDT
ncbi:TRAP transporter small permease subunit [Plastorhodobacter daqingensis]|uniref:TRAP transporter small permease protein n=1 Tax=Plastorhodobacter daqingensis TaxID=1387281 RepID=A0ABW2UIP9_9RHOB